MSEQPKRKSHENRHVVIRNGDAFGNLVLCIDCVQNATASYVPRATPAQVLRSHETPAHARVAFAIMLHIMQDHGWTIIHDGRPNFG
jgi:hypothetical protein